MAGLKLAGNSTPVNAPNAVTMNNALGSSAARDAAGHCGLAAAGAAPGRLASLGSCRRALLRRLARGMYGQVTYHGRDGTVAVAFEQGTVESASRGHLVVRAADGTTWGWDLAGNSVIRADGENVSGRALSPGALVFVAGVVSGGARDGRLVVVRAANRGSARNASAPPSANSPAA